MSITGPEQYQDDQEFRWRSIRLDHSMAKPYLIIDGYNLMHAAGIARPRYAPGQLERCRHRLQKLLSQLLSPDARARTTVVYDAFTSWSDYERDRQEHELRVIFAAKGTDADSEIERLLTKHSSPRQVIVVSSDHRVQKAANRRRAKSVDSEDFLNELQQPPTGHQRHFNTDNTAEKPVQALPESDLDRILKESVAIDEAEAIAKNSEQIEQTASGFDAAYLNQLQHDLKNGRFK